MTRKRCLKLMMSHLCGQPREAEKWHRIISGMLKPPVRNVDVLLRFHAISYHLAGEAGDGTTATYALSKCLQMRTRYGNDVGGVLLKDSEGNGHATTD